MGDFEPIGGELGRLLVVGFEPRAVVPTHAVDVKPFLSDAADDSASRVHVHGLANGQVHPLSLKNGKPTDVAFEARFPEPGMYRLLAVFRPRGEAGGLLSVGFWVDAQPGAGAGE